MIESIFSPFPFGVCRFSEIENRLISCRNLRFLPKNAASVIVLLFPYWLGEESTRETNLSLYAIPADYHTIVGKKLSEFSDRLKKTYPENSFVPFCDNSPIPEVAAAVLSGVGVPGKNGLLIHQKYGSFCFIGEIVTDLELPPTGKSQTDCLQCGACVSACPTGALSKDGFVREICLSEITQKKGELTEQEKNWIAKSRIAWGCDICQKVCPMNRGIEKSPILEFYETAIPKFQPQNPIQDRAYAWRGERTILRNYDLILK